MQDKRLHPASVARILKRAVERLGFDETLFACHSLRAGFVTQAYLNDASEFDIMRQTRHKSLTTMRRYIRDHTLFRKNAAAKWACSRGTPVSFGDPVSLLQGFSFL